MNNFSKLGEELDSLLKLKTPSIGIKFFETVSDIPDEFEVLKDDVMVCQVIGMARFNEVPLAATKDSATACSMGGGYRLAYTIPRQILWTGRGMREPGRRMSRQLKN